MSDPKQELVEKVTQLVKQRYGGDWNRAFRHYSGLGGSSGLVDRDAVAELLKDAGIGNAMTRGAWTRGIVKELDEDEDLKISWDEFRKIFE